MGYNEVASKKIEQNQTENIMALDDTITKALERMEDRKLIDDHYKHRRQQINILNRKLVREKRKYIEDDGLFRGYGLDMDSDEIYYKLQYLRHKLREQLIKNGYEFYERTGPVLTVLESRNQEKVGYIGKIIYQRTISFGDTIKIEFEFNATDYKVRSITKEKHPDILPLIHDFMWEAGKALMNERKKVGPGSIDVKSIISQLCSFETLMKKLQEKQKKIQDLEEENITDLEKTKE